MPDDKYFTVLRLGPTLPLEVHTELSKAPLPALIGEDETLEAMLDIAVDTAAYDGDWAGLIILRECLLKWAGEAEDALRQIARQGPAKSSLGVES